ncbi:MAG: DNA polymerase III subunit gamma/tau [Clostridia bacterium]|nr:DNA polymerase III subunit gamma/tau [Clostridia bacterium]
MAYQALYRTYRPERFGQMAGQKHITTILKNQVREGQLSHAYLFCGSRGTGKTTTARILAKAINCLHPEEGEPCLGCENCRTAAGQNADIIEIDAASNNSVENVRELISQAQFAPLQLRYRVFIIDEVHMLSGSAFNALLKTLEEPPEHVVFILATTEPQKLPATIISRCQRFDFHRLTVPEIMGYMQYILKADGAQAEPDGLRIIARAADGGMRDALSLLDQCLSFCHGRVTAGDVESILGIMDESFLFDMAEKLLTGDGRGALMGLDEVVRQGRDMTVFAGELAGHMRSLLLAKACGDCADMLSCTQDRMARYQQQAAKHPNARILYAMEQLMGVQNDMRYYPSPRMLLETVLVRIAQPVEDQGTEALAARIALLEEKLKVLTEQGIPAAPAAAPAAAAPAQPVYEEDYLPEPPPEEGYLPEEAYEPPAAPAPAPVPEPAPKPIEERPPAPAPAAAPAAPQGPASANEADALWKQVLSQVQKVNALIHKSAAFGQATALTEDQLTVSFAPAYAGKMKMLNARSVAVLQGELDKLKPGVRLLLREGESDGDVADLVGLFKDKLTIT